jgi:hypothetical protein
MNTDKQQIPMKVHRVTRKKPMNGPDLLEFYLSILSYHPRARKVKEHPVRFPSVCATTKHLLPTSEGFKEAEGIKEGDILLCDLSMVVK